MEKVIYESPTAGYRVEVEQVDLNIDHSVRSTRWVVGGFYSRYDDAEEEARYQERGGGRARIVMVEPVS